MHKKKAFLVLGLIGLLIAAIIGVTAYRYSRMDPVYQGKRLSVWLEGYHSGNLKAWDDADRAVQHFGARAIPLMLAMLERNDSKIIVRIKSVVQRWHLIPGTPGGPRLTASMENWNAALAFSAIRWEATREVPTLMRIYQKNVSATSRAAAAYSLGVIGPAAREAVPVLREGIANSRTAREDSITALGEILAGSTEGVPIFIHYSKDPDPKIRTLAILALGRSRPATDQALLALKEAVNDDSPEVSKAARQVLWLFRSDLSVRFSNRRYVLPDRTSHFSDEAIPLITFRFCGP